MARRAVIDRQELFKAANQLVEEGKDVTALALLKSLGGGSFNTIYKYLKEWEEERAKAPKVTATKAELPDTVQNAFLSTWKVATAEAAREVTAAREEAANEVQAAQKQFDDALEAIKQLETDSEADEKQIEALKNRVAELEAALTASGNESAALKATAEQLRQQVRSQQAEIDHLHKDRDTDRQLHQEQLDRLNTDYGKLQERSSTKIEQISEQVASLEKKSEQLEIKLEQTTERMAAAEQSRELANKERDAAMKEAAELKGQTELLKAQNAELLSKLTAQGKPAK